MTSQENSHFRAVAQRACEGSEEAIRELTEIYGPHIQRVIRRKLSLKLRSKFDSVDFLQMVWQSFFTEPEKLAQFSEPSDLIRYLARMGINKVLNESRRRLEYQAHNVRYEQSLDSPNEPEVSFGRSHDTPSQMAIANERYDAILRACSERDRKVLELRISGMSYVEIGKELNLHERTVRQIMQELAKTEPVEA
ncbi:MAG TPA: sigma-70 family RNA polymerase sigma factor [Nitrospiraceae bacterium]|nr:sigma-70 family RNA polymerase sigma factor [Nitrospiraceae bacterium]